MTSHFQKSHLKIKFKFINFLNFKLNLIKPCTPKYLLDYFFNYNWKNQQLLLIIILRTFYTKSRFSLLRSYIKKYRQIRKERKHSLLD